MLEPEAIHAAFYAAAGEAQALVNHLGLAARSAPTAKADFLAGPAWNDLFEQGMERNLPERLWTSLLAGSEIRSPWADTELRLLEVKGLGNPGKVRPG